MNHRRKYPRKTKGNKDWLCKLHKSFKKMSGWSNRRPDRDWRKDLQ